MPLPDFVRPLVPEMSLSIVVAPVTVSPPPFRATLPVPRLLSVETESVPPVTVVVPV